MQSCYQRPRRRRRSIGCGIIFAHEAAYPVGVQRRGSDIRSDALGDAGAVGEQLLCGRRADLGTAKRRIAARGAVRVDHQGRKRPVLGQSRRRVPVHEARDGISLVSNKRWDRIRARWLRIRDSLRPIGNEICDQCEPQWCVHRRGPPVLRRRWQYRPTEVPLLASRIALCGYSCVVAHSKGSPVTPCATRLLPIVWL